MDRQYEMNNNADLDNGVYHKVDEEEEEEKKDNSLENSFQKESMHSQEEEVDGQ